MEIERQIYNLENDAKAKHHIKLQMYTFLLPLL